jgi:hypothetical protein
MTGMAFLLTCLLPTGEIPRPGMIPVCRVSLPTADTVFYYDQSGSLIDAEPDSSVARNRSYVIMTSLTKMDVYSEDPDRKTDTSEMADIRSIPGKLAGETRNAIRQYRLSDPLVRLYTVEILNMSDLRKIRRVIKDNGRGGHSPGNNREYFGVIGRNGRIKDYEGTVFTPAPRIYREVHFLSVRTDIDFHSHPSGDTLLTYDDGGRVRSSNQWPSDSDQVYASRWHLSYEFGMGAPQRIFVFNPSGVLAVFPMDKIKPLSAQELARRIRRRQL